MTATRSDGANEEKSLDVLATNARLIEIVQFLSPVGAAQNNHGW